MVIGWGKNIKEIGYYGILKCRNCKNYADFDICELSSNVKLYFFTVAKYNKKRYLRCGTCGCGYELNKSQYDELLLKLPERFDKGTTDEILNLINTRISQIDREINVEDIDKMRTELVEKYKNSDNVLEIIDTYFQCVLDDDKAR